MEQFPLRRATALVAPVAALALGGVVMLPNNGSNRAQEQNLSVADAYTNQHEMRDMREQLLSAQEAEVAREQAEAERAAVHARASRSRRLALTASKRLVSHPKVSANLLQDVHALGGCESGNNPRENTGNGYYGEDQFDMTTWRSNGYTKYAPRPDLASESEQTAAVIDLHSKRGWEPWPSCARQLGLFTHHYVSKG
jgi:uncharacterized protein involved in type VI secretion and phage assembly